MQKTALCGRSAYGSNRYVTKTLLVMKLTFILLTAALLQVSAKSVSQNIQFRGTNVPLEKVLASVKQQAGVVFIYEMDLIKNAKPVTIEASNMPLADFLTLALKNEPFIFSIINKTITISRKKSAEVVDDLANQTSSTVIESSNQQLLLLPIRGRILDDVGQPLTGASVSVKKSKSMGVTDAEGMFTINVNEGDVIVVTFVGYQSKDVKVSSSMFSGGTINITLSKVSAQLDEMQVIAYGSTTKRFTTGNISTVKAADIEKQPVNNPLLALQARVPGMFITQNSGVPGAGVSVQIRGTNSIGNGNDPLYIIDGVPYVSQLLPNLGTNILRYSGSSVSGNPLSFINPTDIEDISVLKDADATAIYGSRGANGVVLITTKKGSAGKPKISVGLSTGFGTVAKKIAMMNTQQYLNMRREAFNNDGVDPNLFNAPELLDWDTTRYTDWQKELIGGTAHYTKIQSSMSGGTVNNQYLIAGTYSKETSVFPSDYNNQTASAHLSLNTTSSNLRFKSILMVNYLVGNNRLPNFDYTSYINTPPNTPEPLDTNGNLTWEKWSDFNNPFAITKRLYNSSTNNMVSNYSFSYELFKKIVLKGSFGYTNMQIDETSLVPITSQNPAYNPTGSGSFTKNIIQTWIIEPQLIYKTFIGQGNLEFLSGLTFQKNKSKGDILDGSGYTSDALLESIQAAPRISISSIMSLYKYNAVFARLNYNLKNKYLLNATVRRDGSSRFGDNNKFHSFGSLGAGWIFSDENLIKKLLPFLSFGKLRVSFGTTGNDQIGDYSYYNLFANNFFQPYQGVKGLNPTSIYNPNLQWEETKKTEVAIDLGFLNDKILVNISNYKNRSSNQLLSTGISTVSGFSYNTTNLPATVQNNGWEISINTTNIKTKNFDWRSSFNITVPRNKLIAFPDLENSIYKYSLMIGQSIRIIEAFRYAGINDTTGVYQFFDNKGNRTYSADFSTDMTATVNTDPRYYGGFSNSFNYKGFQLDFTFQFVKQKGTNPLFLAPGGRFGTNAPVEFLKRWQNPGDEAPLQKFTQSYSSPAFQAYQYNVLYSDYAYTDASFIRLKNAAISYNLSSSQLHRMKFQGLKIYVTGQNLLTITKFKGLDPENSGFPGLSPALPPLRVITFGLEATF